MSQRHNKGNAQGFGANDKAVAHSRQGSKRNDSLAIHGHWEFVARKPNSVVRAIGLFLIGIGLGFVWSKIYPSVMRACGDIKWTAEISNLVVNEGLDELLDRSLVDDTIAIADAIGLMDSSPTVAGGDTMSSHSGWAEVTAYSEANRQGYSPAAPSGQSVDNSGSPATFTINSNNTTIGGAFLSTDNTKGGTAGTLISAGAFSAGDKTLDNGDTLDVTITYNASSS